MAVARRTWLMGAHLLSALAITCSPFSSGDDGNPSGDGGSAGPDDAAPGTDGGGPSMPDAANGAVRWCDDGGYAFCADFDNLGAAASPNTGWTDAVRDSVGSSLTLTQAETLSAPNAARLEFPQAGGTELFLTQTTEAGGPPIKTATLRFAIRPKIGPLIPDAGDPLYTIGSLKIRDATGNELGHSDLDWRSQKVTSVTWKGNGGGVGDVWQRQAGTLAIDDWVVVSIELDIVNRSSSAQIRDVNGILLGQHDLGGFDWGEAHSVTFELGVWKRDEERPALTLTFDNVALEITH